MPVNWYAALVVIVLIGLGSIAFAKYHYNQHPPVVEPTTNTTWHAALAFDICGTMQPALAASPTGGTTGLTTSGDGVLLIAPKSASEAGNNATLGKFAQGYAGLTLTNTTLKYPSSSVPEYRNGQKCAAGTKDAGKVGEVQARTWIVSTATSNGEQKEVGGLTSVQPADLKFQNRQLITVGFVPSGTQLPKPPSSTILALVQVLNGAQPAATTTTTAGGTPTSTPTTGVPTTTTTVPATTTTKPSSTTTTK
jgi:hypothetical protein